MCEPNAPRFAREGDDFMFAVKVTNTEDVPQKGVVELRVGELRVGELRSWNLSRSDTPHKGRRPDWRTRASSRARRDFDPQRKGARHGARVEIMSAGARE
jgi:hypothetical protein